MDNIKGFDNKAQLYTRCGHKMYEAIYMYIVGLGKTEKYKLSAKNSLLKVKTMKLFSLKTYILLSIFGKDKRKISIMKNVLVF